MPALPPCGWCCRRFPRAPSRLPALLVCAALVPLCASSPMDPGHLPCHRLPLSLAFPARPVGNTLPSSGHCGQPQAGVLSQGALHELQFSCLLADLAPCLAGLGLATLLCSLPRTRIDRKWLGLPDEFCGCCWVLVLAPGSCPTRCPLAACPLPVHLGLRVICTVEGSGGTEGVAELRGEGGAQGSGCSLPTREPWLWRAHLLALHSLVDLKGLGQSRPVTARHSQVWQEGLVRMELCGGSVRSLQEAEGGVAAVLSGGESVLSAVA